MKLPSNMTYPQLKAEILSNPCTRGKLKAAIESFDDMDCVDALKDAVLLAELLKRKCKELNKSWPIFNWYDDLHFTIK